MKLHRKPAPSEQDILCEDCGHVLTGLPEEAVCPQCGSPVDLSTRHSGRQQTDWEDYPSMGNFLRVCVAVLLTPWRFFQQLSTSGDLASQDSFIFMVRLVSMVPLACAVAIHLSWVDSISAHLWFGELGLVEMVPLMGLGIYFLHKGVTVVAAWLTVWEASFLGMRLPYPVVMRTLTYHAVTFLPTSLVFSATIIGYHMLVRLGVLTLETAPTYLYVLAGEVVVAAVYLFYTYWLAMWSVRFANPKPAA